jgi:glycosyltransferase involved in cell wall biosynthesis
MLISIIVPCYNEEAMIPMFYNELCSIVDSLSNYSFEIIFVDDGSHDTSLEKMRTLSANDGRVKYISFSRNFGKESAMYAGLSMACGDLVAIMDVDLQDPPSLLPRMIHYFEEGYDSVATRRVNREGEPPIRSFFARIFYKLINKMADIDIVDGARDYRLMTRRMVDSILSMREYHRFSKGIFGWVGYRTKWIEYENIERIAGESNWSFWKLFKYAIEGIVAFTTAPLRIASFSGIVFSAISFIYLFYIVLNTLLWGVDVPGYASTIVIVLLIGGIQLLSIGILGEYLARTYMEVKQRPIYVVKESNIEQKRKIVFC